MHSQSRARIAAALLEAAEALEASRWRKPSAEERSAAAKKAALTRRARQIPMKVTVNGRVLMGWVPSTGWGSPSEGGSLSVYFRSKRELLKKLGDLPMKVILNERGDGDTGPTGDETTLGEVLTDSSSGLNVRLSTNDQTGLWQLSAYLHHFKAWRSMQRLRVKVEPTTVPDPVDF